MKSFNGMSNCSGVKNVHAHIAILLFKYGDYLTII